MFALICTFSKARSVLEPSMIEFSEIGYVSEWELAPTTDRHDFEGSLSPGENLPSLPHLATATGAGAHVYQVEATLPPWVGRTGTRGVSQRRGRWSYRELVEMMAERGVTLAHTTIMRWFLAYARRVREAVEAVRQTGAGASWRVDQRISGERRVDIPVFEPSIKMAGRWIVSS